jgi:regulator of replication initiation timing
MKGLSLSLTDQDIKEYFDYALEMQKGADQSKSLDIAAFAQLAQQAYTQKPLPQYLSSAPKAGSKIVPRGGIGAAVGGNNTQFENWELEKKYKTKEDALKQEIEEKNKEIQNARKEVQDKNARCIRLEIEKSNLETRLVDKHARPPAEMSDASKNQGAFDEIQRLKDEIFHL